MTPFSRQLFSNPQYAALNSFGRPAVVERSKAVCYCIERDIYTSTNHHMTCSTQSLDIPRINAIVGVLCNRILNHTPNVLGTTNLFPIKVGHPSALPPISLVSTNRTTPRFCNNSEESILHHCTVPITKVHCVCCLINFQSH